MRLLKYMEIHGSDNGVTMQKVPYTWNLAGRSSGDIM